MNEDNKTTITELFEKSSKLSEPVIADIIYAIQQQEKIIPGSGEYNKKNGWEIIHSQKFSNPIYEILSYKPELSSIFGISVGVLIALFPLPSLAGLSAGSLSGYLYYQYLSYYGVRIYEGQETLQSMKQNLSLFLESLIELKKQINAEGNNSERKEVLSSEEKYKLQLINKLIKLCGKDLYIKLRNSTSVNTKTLFNILELSQNLFSDNNDMFFNKIWMRSKYFSAPINIGENKDGDQKLNRTSSLNLGEPPKESTREDAISAGIEMARKLTALENDNGKPSDEKTQSPKRKKTKDSKKSKKDSKNEPPTNNLSEKTDNEYVETHKSRISFDDKTEEMTSNSPLNTPVGCAPCELDPKDPSEENPKMDENQLSDEVEELSKPEYPGESFDNEDIEVINKLKEIDQNNVKINDAKSTSLLKTYSDKLEYHDSHDEDDKDGEESDEFDEVEFSSDILDLPVDDEHLPEPEDSLPEASEDGIEGLDEFMKELGEEDDSKQ